MRDEPRPLGTHVCTHGSRASTPNPRTPTPGKGHRPPGRVPRPLPLCRLGVLATSFLATLVCGGAASAGMWWSLKGSHAWFTSGCLEPRAGPPRDWAAVTRWRRPWKPDRGWMEARRDRWQEHRQTHMQALVWQSAANLSERPPRG